MDVKVVQLALRQFASHLKPIQSAMDDAHVTEIMLNEPGEFWVEREGVMTRHEAPITAVNMTAAIRALATANDRDIAAALDCRMPGYRIAAALPPVGVRGPAICIRKHAHEVRDLGRYADSFTGGRARDAAVTHEPLVDPRVPASYIAWLDWLVHAKKNFLIVGSTGSGKTTFLNALLARIPDTERVLTIEDTAELQRSTPNAVGLEANGEADIRTLVRLALRFRPDRIVVGEVRGPETYDLLDALNTGHDGGGTTIHAPSAEQGLYQLENFVRMNSAAGNYPLTALRQQIATTFHAVIFCAHRGAARGPESIVRVLGTDEHGYRVEPVFDAFASLPGGIHHA